MRFLPAPLAWIVVAISLPQLLPAQAPPEAVTLASFRDTLRSIGDSGRLSVLERTLRAATRSGNDRIDARLRLGFVQLRRGEIDQDRSAFADAEQSFGAVIGTKGSRPAAWFGRGLARLNQIAEQSAAGGAIDRLLGSDPAGAAASDFAMSATLDSQFIDGLVEVGAIAGADYSAAHLRAALLAMRRIASRPVAHNTSVQLARLRIERITGAPDSAARIAEDLLRRFPRDPVVLLEGSHALLMRGDEGAERGWFLGLTLADGEAARLYRSDLEAVLPDSLLRRFDATRGEERANLVRRFFAFDEFGQTRSSADRLREHYERLDYARRTYTVRSVAYRADDGGVFRPDAFPMDERGLVWVLHGKPDDHTHLNMLSAPPNESWHYKGDDGGELLFHFIKTDARGYRRVPSLFDILAMTKPLQATGHGDPKAMAERGEAVQTYGASWTAQTVQDMLYSREAMSPTYGRMLSRGKNGALELQREERLTGDSSIAHGETRGARYELPLDAQIDAVAVGSDATGSLLQVAFAIPGGSLYAPPSTGPVSYAVRMRVSVIRRGTAEVVAAIDTLRTFVAPHAIPVDATLFGRLPVRVPPGDYTIRIALETPGRGVMSPRLGVRVAGVAGGTLDLSDLALGARSVRLPWRTPNGDSMWVNPARAFRSGEPMQLYFEVLGVPPGTAYRTDLVIFRTTEQRPEFTLGFSATTSASPDGVHREVDITRLKPGSYQLQVTISTARGERVVRRGEFTVIK